MKSLFCSCVSFSLFFTLSSQYAYSSDVCSRSKAVKLALEESLQKGCSEINDNDLLHLTTLSIKDIGKIENSDFHSLTNLKDLTLITFWAKELPARLFENLANLEVLTLEYLFPKSQNVPAELLSGLSNLKKFEIDKSFIKTIPGNFFESSKNLKEIRITNGLLESLPEETFRGLSKLEILDLSKNRLKMTPQTFLADLENLNKLDLSYNRITTLPEALFDGLTKVQYINLVKNRLQNVPEDLFINNCGLKIIFAGYNSFTEKDRALLEQGICSKETIILF